ncbi:MAG: CDP-alcohol phosphatidyltransferase family protein [Euzebya sp.]
MTSTSASPDRSPDVDGGGLYALKSVTAIVLSRPVRWAVSAGVSADRITWIGTGLAALSAVAVLLGATVSATVWLAVLPLVLARLLCAVADGQIARQSRTVHPSGAVLGEMTDRAGDVALAAALLPVAPGGAVIAMVAMLAADSVSAIGWAVTGRRHFAGAGGKPDRNILVGVGLIVAVWHPPAAGITVWLLAGVSVVGLVWRWAHLARDVSDR